MAISDSQPTVRMEPGNPANFDRYLAFRATANRMGTFNIGYSVVGIASRLFGWSQVIQVIGSLFSISKVELRQIRWSTISIDIRLSRDHICSRSLSQISQAMVAIRLFGSSLVIQVIQIIIQHFDLRHIARVGVL